MLLARSVFLHVKPVGLPLLRVVKDEEDGCQPFPPQAVVLDADGKGEHLCLSRFVLPETVAGFQLQEDVVTLDVTERPRVLSQPLQRRPHLGGVYAIAPPRKRSRLLTGANRACSVERPSSQRHAQLAFVGVHYAGGYVGREPAVHI